MSLSNNATLEMVKNLSEDIEAEASARASADNTLQSNIDSEATARQSADTALDARVTAIEDGTTSAATADKLASIQLTSDDDLDDIMDEGKYVWTTPIPSNAPCTYGVMHVVYANSSSYAKQIVFRQGSSQINNYGTHTLEEIYIRGRDGGVPSWTDWHIIPVATGTYSDMTVGTAAACTGNAATATQLATARTIQTNLASTSSASFNGTANITPGVTGTLAVANGGTGLTASPSMLVNLESETAANVLQASPRPGVTGILPVANGGTGASSLTDAGIVTLSDSQTITGTKTFTGNIIFSGPLRIGVSGSAATSSYSSAIAIGAGASGAGARAIVIGNETSGSSNDVVVIGAYASAGTAGIAIGYEAEALVDAISVGRYSYATANYAVAIGRSASTSTGYQMVLGNSTYCTSIITAVSPSTSSDERDKTDIEDINDDTALEFINSLRTVTFARNPRTSYEYRLSDLDENASDETKALYEKSEEYRKTYGLGLYDTAAHAAGTKKGTRRTPGLLAQDVEEAMQTYFSGTEYAALVNDTLYDLVQAQESIPDGVESEKTVNYSNFVPFLISAIQAQQKKIEELETKIAALTEV